MSLCLQKANNEPDKAAIHMPSMTNGHTPNGIVNGNSNNHPNGTVNGTSENGLNGHVNDSINKCLGDSSGLNGTPRASNLGHEPIAICGIGVRLPRGIQSPADLYDFLINKQDARTTVPTDRFNVDAYFDETGKAGTIKTRHVYFLDQDLTKFDAPMFKMSNAEIAQLDPSQRLLLEVTREAFETASESNFRGKNIGTFIGNFTADWEDLQNVDHLHYAPDQLTGKTDFVLSNRLAFEYNLLGPSVNTETACSATAEALYEAVLAIRTGSCPAAIVGGANIILTPRLSIGMTAMGVLSPDGSCKSFDANANGYARGESVCALYLKRLDLAIRDSNPVRAVISACESNADGGDGLRTFGTPNPIAQEALIRQTYEGAGLSLLDTKVVECHGTGTPVGDPLETTAVARCFGGDGRVYIGSLKPNLGHSEGASAMASTIKAILSLENRMILPNIKFNEPNPKIPWECNLEVPLQATPWPRNVRERISVNSFGLGGSNVHIVIDSAVSAGVSSQNTSHLNTCSQAGRSVLLLSAADQPALEQLASRYAAYALDHPELRGAMLHTVGKRRERLKLASYCTLDGSTVSKLAPAVESQNLQQVAFVFTGQGAQWVGMGREMMEENLDFANSIRHMDDTLRKLQHAPQWTLAETLLAGNADKDLLSPADRSHPACAAVQIAYVDALAACEIRPCAVVGHSSGEMAAAYAAGVLTREEAITLAYYRGYACAQHSSPGGMAAVGIGSDEVKGLLRSGVVVACENSNASVTLSGDLQALEDTIADIKAAFPGIFVRQLHVAMAYHSHHMTSSASLYRSLISPHLTPKPPQVPYYSTVRGRKVAEAKSFGPQYWQLSIQNQVLFRTAAGQMLTDLGGRAALLEIGPHSALAGSLRQIYKEIGYVPPYASVAERGQDATIKFLEGLGKLYAFGIIPKVPGANDGLVVPDLPTYPWNHDSSFWAETRMMADWRFRKHPKHELLGQRALESSEVEPMWRNIIKLGEVAWLEDHRVGNDIVFPAAGYFAMAGVAISQITGSTSYTLQDVEIATAMLLTEKKATEVVTTFRRHNWTRTNESKWWEFSITSEHNGIWAKHCSGLVTPGCAAAQPNATIASYARKVSSARWYTAFTRIGLNYGPRFTEMENISASPVHQKAALTITDRQSPGDMYALHPSTLDLVLQSWSVAWAQGEFRELDTLYLPTFVEQLYVGDKADKTINVQTSSLGLPGTAEGQSFGIVDDEVAFVLKGFHGTKMQASAGDETADQSTMFIQWHPAIDFTPVEKLIRPVKDITHDIKFVERFGLLVACEIWHETLGIASYVQPYFKHYLDGIQKQIDEVDQGRSFVPDAAVIKAMTRDERQKELEASRASSVGGPVAASIEALYRAYANIRAVLAGDKTWLDVLLVDDILANFYNETNSFSDIADYFRTLGTNKPQLRVLEIGAGTGGTTAAVLDGLHSLEGERLYGSYTVTDISAGFVNRCKERFQKYGNLSYAVLDISADPRDQGFEMGSFDVVLGSNVMHATPNLVETMSRCQALLKPDGRLFIQELSSDLKQLGLIMGLFEGWWLGIEDGRSDRPYISVSEWEDILRQSGFDGIEAAVRDSADPDHFANVNITARPQAQKDRKGISKRVTLLQPSHELDGFGQQVKLTLEREGFEVDECIWGQTISPQEQDVLSLVDVASQGAPLLADINAEDLAAFQRLIEDNADNAIVWLMRPAQTSCLNAHYGQMLGVARGIRAELAIDMVTLELDSLGPESCEAAVKLYCHIVRERAAASQSDESQIESEFVWRQGQMLLSRTHASSVAAGLDETAPRYEAKHLVIGQRGMLQTMRWCGHPLPPIAEGDVQLRMRAAGLDFHDVATAMGIIEAMHSEEDGYHALGSEGAAVVTAVGANVKHVAVGDRVVVMEFHGAVFATEIQASAALCARIPDNLSDDDAAGMLLPYVTVLWSLIEKARFHRGQSLLIHSAAGGVGIAAINVARWLGADIYCTVGSEAKVEFLTSTLDVPRNRIFYSRDDGFLGDVIQATNGRGIDVVLNSLSGELLHATWKCVAPFGCVLDLGKRDFTGGGRLSMYPFLHNRAYFGVDVASVAVTNVAALVPYFNQVIDLFRDRHIAALHPTTTFDAAQIDDAFRYMQKGAHVGRIVVRIPENHGDPPLTLSTPRPIFNGNAAYLIVGGLGGLGRSIVSWMVSHGARNISVVSPSAGLRPQHHDLADEMSQMGGAVRFFAGDVADTALMGEVIAATGQAIKGVIQLAMVLDDAGFLNMDIDTWMAATNPKIKGTLNLHDLLLSQDLDFFVMTGSVSGSLASYGQTNYAAGNAFLDAFVQYRHGLGLPASVIVLDAVGDIGFVADSKEISQRLSRATSKFITEQDFLRGLHLVIERSSKNFVAALPTSTTMAYEDAGQVVLHNEMNRSVKDVQNTVPWSRDPRMLVFRNIQETSISGNSNAGEGLRSFLASLSSNRERLESPETASFLAQEVAKRVFAFLMKEDTAIDTSYTLLSMGADSLVAIEIRNWWKQAIGVDVSVLELADPANTIEHLGALAASRLRAKTAS